MAFCRKEEQCLHIIQVGRTVRRGFEGLHVKVRRQEREKERRQESKKRESADADGTSLAEDVTFARISGCFCYLLLQRRFQYTMKSFGVFRALTHA